SRGDLTAVLRLMLPGLLLGVLAGLLSLVFRSEFEPVVWLLVVVWLASPLVTYWISLPTPIKVAHLPDKDRIFVRSVSRLTWRFFETFVGPGDHWLPPDNFQEDTAPVVAHRTSPTNIALLLLSTGSAYRFGYISTLELVERLELTFGTLGKLTKFNGHFLNWYDTETLEPLTPKSVSICASGNLPSHLMA